MTIVGAEYVCDSCTSVTQSVHLPEKVEWLHYDGVTLKGDPIHIDACPDCRPSTVRTDVETPKPQVRLAGCQTCNEESDDLDEDSANEWERLHQCETETWAEPVATDDGYDGALQELIEMVKSR
jgi:hypothetical protein